MFEVGNYDDERAVQERPHSKTSSQAGTSVGSSHFAKLYNEKRSELEDQQVHLRLGLSKITETVEQVEELQKSLAVKRTELEKKNNEANQKLKQMMNDKQEAEKKKVTSEELKETLRVSILY